VSAVPPLALSGLAWGWPGRELGAGLRLEVGRGEAVALLGANGAGKTTLLRTCAGMLAPLAGSVALGGADAGRLRAEERARRVALLPQQLAEDEGLTVRELVELGRTPHLGLFGHLGPRDREAVAHALAACELVELAARRLSEISGGERQRARLALAVAQDAPLLLLDEPASHLDLRRRHELFELLRRLRRERGLALAIVLHEPADAFREAERVLLLHDRRAEELRADSPRRVELLARAFGVPEDRIAL
jgi:iron complex transport system ATP-binding protein